MKIKIFIKKVGKFVKRLESLFEFPKTSSYYCHVDFGGKR